MTPPLMLATWVLAAPRHTASWTDPFGMLVFPGLFLATTLVAGAYGEGYPYDFLDVSKIGLGRVLVVALAFLFVFLVLGWGIGIAARRLSVRSA